MCPALEDLYLKTGEPITEDWFEYHYNVHKTIDEMLFGVTSVISYGYVRHHIIPYQDAILDIGRPDLRFNRIFAMTGYFDDNVFVQGKRVIKDGDPISIYDIYSLAQLKIAYAIDSSYYVSLLLPMNARLLDILLELEEENRKLDTIHRDIYSEEEEKPIVDIVREIRDRMGVAVYAPSIVSIKDIYAQAQWKIIYAIDSSYYVSLLEPINAKLSDVILRLEEEKRRIDDIYERMDRPFDTSLIEIGTKAQYGVAYAIDKSYYVRLILPINEKIQDILLELEDQKRIVQDIRDKIVKTNWEHEFFVGTPTPISGSAGINIIEVKSGGYVDFDPSGKYLKSFVVELETNEIGDYILEMYKTNGVAKIVFVRNVPLAFINKEFDLVSPVFIEDGYWITSVIHLASAKSIALSFEFVW